MSSEKTVTEEVEALIEDEDVIEMAQELPEDVDTKSIAFSMNADAEAENRQIDASPGAVAQAINVILGR